MKSTAILCFGVCCLVLGYVTGGGVLDTRPHTPVTPHSIEISRPIDGVRSERITLLPYRKKPDVELRNVWVVSFTDDSTVQSSSDWYQAFQDVEP